jgi:type IV pilus assembly protein PilQ
VEVKKESDTTAAAAAIDSDVSSLLDETPKYTGRLISLDLQDTDIDNALRIIAEVSNLNIIASEDVTGKVTLRLIDVPWDQALDVILKTNGLDKVQEGNVIRIAPVEKLRQEREALKQAIQAADDLEPLSVKYIRVSYAKASDLKPLVETVLSERGSVTYDERTNQLIIKDIHKGVKNVAELVGKLDLRTPQVLLETQIVEASRSLLRDLGSELGFQYIRSPELGNATGYNFPNSINVGGSLPNGNVSGFPATVTNTSGSALSMLFGSADGSKSLSARLTALEKESKVRVISRPAVATTNNKQALIKSVEKIRVKTPSGGNSVSVGQGASTSGSGGVATETIEIGIMLEVTPQASPDYYVLLDINAKSSTFGSHPVDGIPSELERAATSTVLVSSGQTFAMGGIYKISDNDTVDGVPFFKDIPFIGHLFRHQNVNKSDEELIFFITPRIVEGSFDDAAMKVAS